MTHEKERKEERVLTSSKVITDRLTLPLTHISRFEKKNEKRKGRNGQGASGRFAMKSIIHSSSQKSGTHQRKPSKS